MAVEIGSIVEVKITGLTKFGAFVALDDGLVGMIHISEVAFQFIDDLSKHLTVGQTVRAKVLKVDENGRYSLSIKKAQPRPAPVQPQRRTSPSAPVSTPAPSEQSFEDKLKQFMQSSDSRISDLRHNTDRKTGGKRKR